MANKKSKTEKKQLKKWVKIRGIRVKGVHHKRKGLGLFDVKGPSIEFFPR